MTVAAIHIGPCPNFVTEHHPCRRSPGNLDCRRGRWPSAFAAAAAAADAAESQRRHARRRGTSGSRCRAANVVTAVLLPASPVLNRAFPWHNRLHCCGTACRCSLADRTLIDLSSRLAQRCADAGLCCRSVCHRQPAWTCRGVLRRRQHVSSYVWHDIRGRRCRVCERRQLPGSWRWRAFGVRRQLQCARLGQRRPPLCSAHGNARRGGSPAPQAVRPPVMLTDRDNLKQVRYSVHLRTAIRQRRCFAFEASL